MSRIQTLFVALTLLVAVSAGADERYTYVDGLYGKTRAFNPTPEVLVRFDGAWSALEVAAFADQWSLVPTDAEGYVDHLGYGVFALAGPGRLTPDAAAARAQSIEDDAGRGVRTHVGLETDRGRPLRLLPGQIMVQVDPTLPEAARDAVFARWGGEVLATFWTPGYLRVSVPPDRDLFETLRLANVQPEIHFACPDVVGFDDALFVPDDPIYPEQWGLDNRGQTGGTPGADISAEQSWDITRGDPDVLVVVIDNGVSLDHPDLAPNILPRPSGHDWDFTGPDSTGHQGTQQHGTNVAGVVSAVGNNSKGISGVAPGASLVPLKVTLSTEQISQRIDAVNYAASWGTIFDRVVINCSWRVTVDDPAMQAACDNAFAAGCVVTASAGNDGLGFIEWPAAYASTIAIGATRHTDVRDSRSHFGPELELVAPGDDIWTCQPGGGYQLADGTSLAAPFVSGVAALLWSLDPTLTAAEVRELLTGSADDEVGDPDEDVPGWDPYHGFGRLNAYEALLATGLVKGRVQGTLRAVTDVVALPDDTLSVDPDEGIDHTYRISSSSIDAQSVEGVHVRGIITLHGVTDIDTTVVEIGLVTADQRARALDQAGDPALLFDQGAFARLSRAPGGRMIAPADFAADLPGGTGEGQEAAPAYSFDLWLAPTDSTGGVARLSVNGGAYGDPLPYGVDNETALGGDEAPEDFSEAFLVAQIRSETPVDSAFVAFRNVRVETEAPGWGAPVAGSVRVFETGEQLFAPPSGIFDLELDALVERTLIITAPHALPDTVALNLAHGDTLVFTEGIVQLPRGEARGHLRAVTEIGRIDDAMLQVNVGSLGGHDHVIVDVPIDAQGVDSVHVSGLIELHDLPNEVGDVELQIGLVTAAQRDSALVTEGDPSLLFDQGVFVHYVIDGGVRVLAPGDHDPDIEGGVGEPQPADPILTFDLELTPSIPTGGTMRLSVNGGPFGAAHGYGIDNGTAQGGSFPDEDFSEAYLVVQLHSSSEEEGTVRVRDLRVETIAPGFGEPLEGVVDATMSPGGDVTGPDGRYTVGLPAEIEQRLAFSASGVDPDTLDLRLAHADSLYLPMGLRKFPRAFVRGTLRSVSEVIRLDDDVLLVGEGGSAHDARLTEATFDAQSPDTVRVTGTIELFDAADLDTTVVEIGILTTAQRDSALVLEENPALLFDQGVFVRLWMSVEGPVMAPADLAAEFEGVGEPQGVVPAVTFELVLVPSDTTGGTASLSIDGGPAGAALDYGVDNGAGFDLDLPREDFSDAVLVAQARSLTGPGGQVAFRNVRVELLDVGATSGLVGTITEVETGESTMSDGNGAYLLSPASMAPRRLAYLSPGFLPDTLTVDLVTGDTLFVPVGLAPLPSGAVTGMVTRGETDPLPDVEVRYRTLPHTSITDAGGTYSLPAATIGTYDIRYAGAGYGPRHIRGFEVLADSVQVLDVDILAGFDDDLEFGQGAWTHAPGDDGFLDEWHISGRRNFTADGDSAWKCGGLEDTPYGPTNYSILEMPPVVVPAGHFLSFHHWMDATTLLGGLARHGGRVEVSADSGMVWAPLNPLGGYPFRTPDQYDGALGPGTPVFSGSHDWQPAEFSLAGFVGDTLWVRFVFAADEVGPTGEGWYLDDVLVSDLRVVALDDSDPAPVVAARPVLFQNVPNPFNPTTRIDFELPGAGPAVLTIYDVTGRRVRRLLNEEVAQGVSSVVWNGRDDHARPVGTGLYYYELRVGGEQLTRRMLLLK